MSMFPRSPRPGARQFDGDTEDPVMAVKEVAGAAILHDKEDEDLPDYGGCEDQHEEKAQESDSSSSSSYYSTSDEEEEE